MAEKVNKDERKNMGEIFVFNETQETPDFWCALGIESGEAPEEDLQVSLSWSLIFRFIAKNRCLIIFITAPPWLARSERRRVIPTLVKQVIQSF